jgi:hypothetical protein
MKLLDSDIKQFQSLYVKYFDQVLNEDEARAKLTLLVRQIEIIYQPITQAQYDAFVTKNVNEKRDDDDNSMVSVAH